APGSHDALDWWAASPDGGHVAIGVSGGGSEQSVLHIVNTATGALTPEIITRARFGGVSWLPDGSGLFYTRQPDVPLDSDAAEENLICWFHKLGTDPATDIKVMGRGLSPVVPVAAIDDPYVAATPGSSLAIGTIVSGVQNELTVYSSPLAACAAGHPDWTPICSPTDGVTNLAIRGDDIYLLTHKHAPHYKILKTSALRPEIANAVEVVAASGSIIRALVAARDALYILDLDMGLAGLRRLAPDGSITKIDLPFAGAIDPETFYADTLHDGAWFFLEGWVHPTVVCYVGANGIVTQTDIAPKPPIDTSPYTSLETAVTARDGVKIPLSIIYPRNFKRDGSAPVLLWAYGAYGISEDPAFLARWLPFLDRGGAFAVAHVRGGGELGEDWHLAGQKLNKYHTWQDDIDCAEALIRTHWTSKKHLAIIGGSAGGITVGRFMTERPDLAAVVIDEVGSSDTLRQEFSSNGPPNIPEFGSVTTREGFIGLRAMDSYQHVHNGVKYPSVLLTTGLNDPRVASWQPTKMTARLQAATASKNPVLLRVALDAGHGMGSTRGQQDRETADIIAFVLWRTGDPRFQPPR
ncbi:MAG: prolyl oligopeptidase family serine peptidase, partial [Acidocella sp.]|nr:prolyl oligopeptidase family serine peptidase [Acidocella sp.]